MNATQRALKLAEHKYDVLAKHGRGRRYAPIIKPRKGKLRVVGKRRVRVASCDGTRETERELTTRMNKLREKLG